LFIVSSSKLEIRAEKILPGSEGEREGLRVEGRNGPIYAHMNK
jgi:hypothetical protein